MKTKLYKLGLFMMMCLSLVGCGSQNKLVLKDTPFSFELGLQVNEDVLNYLDTTHLNEKDIEELKENAMFEIMAIEDNYLTKEDNRYLKTGVYPANIQYKKEKVKFEIEIVDTVSPTLSGLERIEMPTGTEFNYLEEYSATDLNELETIQIDSTGIDVNVAGEYTLKVSVNDKAGNPASKEVSVVVLEVNEHQESSSEVITNEEGQQVYKTTITDKPVEPQTPTPPPANSGYQAPAVNTNTPTQDPTPQAPATPQVPTPPPSNDRVDEGTCNPTIWNSGLLFDSLDEAIAYADKFMMDNIEEIGGYGTLTTCGKTTIDWTYY